MDGREAMPLSGSASYYMQQRAIGSPTSANQTSLHGHAGMWPLSGPSYTVQSNISSSAVSTYPVESTTPVAPHVVNTGSAGGLESGESVKRKRGRPRKYVPDGTVALGLSPLSAATPSPALTGQKRGRGRPPGSGKKQQLAEIGEWLADSAGMGFTPHVVTISMGEDIASKIMSFSQQSPRAICVMSACGAVSTVTLRQPSTQDIASKIMSFSQQSPRAICVMSACGAVSTVTLRQPSTSGGTVTYEGRFEIVSLSGSYLVLDSGVSRSRTGGLSVSLASPDGRVIGGGVVGLLIAAGPVQVILGSFNYASRKSQVKQESRDQIHPESGIDSAVGVSPKAGSSATMPNQNPIAESQVLWPGSRPTVDVRTMHRDIDLTRG